MDETIRKLLDNIPERQPRSKLEPHIDVIRELRRKRRSYQEISVFFKEHLKIPVAPSTLYEFVKSRARPVKKTMVELPEVEASRPVETAPVPASQVSRPGVAETRQTVREQPSALPKEPPGFEFEASANAKFTPPPETK
jgi:IS30 family transposase